LRGSCGSRGCLRGLAVSCACIKQGYHTRFFLNLKKNIFDFFHIEFFFYLLFAVWWGISRRAFSVIPKKRHNIQKYNEVQVKNKKKLEKINTNVLFIQFVHNFGSGEVVLFAADKAGFGQRVLFACFVIFLFIFIFVVNVVVNLIILISWRL
jgi:hypothetical protein